MRDALAGRDIGAVFRFLHQRGWSWAAIAQATDIGEQRVREIASGKRRVENYDVYVRVAVGLNIPRDYLGVGLRPPGQRNQSPDAARNLDNALSASGANNSAIPVVQRAARNAQAPRVKEDVTDVLDRIRKLDRSRIDPEIIRQVRDGLRESVAQYETLEHDSLVRHLHSRRAWAEAALEECGHPSQRQHLYEIAGTASGVLGYVAVGRSEFALARAYCLEAFRLADYAGSRNLQAWARATHSFCEYYAGRYSDALELAEDGLRYAEGGPQSVRLISNGVARALGKLGDTQGVHRAIGEADELMLRKDAPDGIASSITLDCYSHAQAVSNAATAYVSLEMPDKVQHYIDLAMPEIISCGSPWSQSLVKIDLAFSFLWSGNQDLEHASTLAREALEASAGRPVVSVQQRVAGFIRAATATWGNVPQIAEIREIAGTLGTRQPAANTERLP
jgi:tetratricopeptide (TPR) repeat protein